MGLRDDIQSDIEEAFDTDLSDAVTSFTYRIVTRTYDTNTNTTSDVNTDYESRGVIGRFKREVFKDSNVLPTDSKIIILQHELAVEPVPDMLIISPTKTYTIIKVRQDPAAATWTLQCRE